MGLRVGNLAIVEYLPPVPFDSLNQFCGNITPSELWDSQRYFDWVGICLPRNTAAGFRTSGFNWSDDWKDLSYRWHLSRVPQQGSSVKCRIDGDEHRRMNMGRLKYGGGDERHVFRE